MGQDEGPSRPEASPASGLETCAATQCFPAPSGLRDWLVILKASRAACCRGEAGPGAGPEPGAGLSVYKVLMCPELTG